MNAQDREELEKVKDDLSHLKDYVNERFNDVMEQLNKPLFSDKQIFSIIISVIVYLVISVNYINGINARSKENKSDIIDARKNDEKVLDLLIEIKEDVANLEGKQSL